MVEVTSSVCALYSPDFRSDVAVTLVLDRVDLDAGEFRFRAEEILVRLEHQLAGVKVDAGQLERTRKRLRRCRGMYQSADFLAVLAARIATP